MKTIPVLSIVALFAFAASSVFAVAPGDKAPDFTLTSSVGEEHSLSDFKGQYVVLEWVNFGCPFVQKHYSVKNMQALQESYRNQGVVWLAICSSAPGKQGHMTGEALREKLEQESFEGTAYLLDESGEVGKAYGAKRTPEMFIINPEGTIIYHGAIDSDSSADSNKTATATNYVVETLRAAMAGDPVPNPSTKPYGCSVKY